MHVTLKLFASLTEYLPPESRYTNITTLELAPGTTIMEVVDAHKLPPKWVHLVLVNGVYVAPENRATHTLHDADVLAIWPPIAGG